ncbi:carbohydrate ABC transporter membrane protein 2 (CUT1 family) [Haloactinopolyspora alba]|uniref:Carbohydrate ABC transporter membrane protein 2 (CUT1 family) n=1 Tax=Haloactinopolyspora alba TaxID=648780 RepID=A0A2P8D217_9ACTN|nr:carbohydrate ABC transporter permease [Haloactinopolyspora alba]PSK91270.1 carbohydrate ABC transporter membrane protein 2 (CUT1 family) [Haloactinopolyspora alba]
MAVLTRPEQEAPTPAPAAGRPPRSLVRSAVFWTFLLVLTLVFVGPIVWMLLTSIKTNPEATSVPPTILPEDPTGAAYDGLMRLDGSYPVLRWFLNSLLAATLHMLLVLAVASPAAYALARLQFKLRGLFFVVIVSTLFVPGFVFLLPNYIIIDKLGWLDTIWALVVPGAAGAFGVFFLRQFFAMLPGELEEAALIDGANQWQIFTRVVLPNSKPALATLAVLSFLTNWNDFIWPIYVLFSPERLTLPAGLRLLQGAYTTDYPVIMAGAFVASVPVLVLFLFTQRYVIEGVSRSGLKG